MGTRQVVDDHDSLVVVGQVQFPTGAEHAVGDHALHRAATDCESAREDGADRRQRDQVPNLEVPRSAHHLDRTVAGIDHHPADLVGPGDAGDLVHPGHHDVGQALADALDLLDHQAEVVEGGGQVGRLAVEGGEITEPRKRYAHCSPLRSARASAWGASRPARQHASELPQEADVVLGQRPHVGDLMAHLGAPVDAEAEGEAGPLVGIDAHRVEDGRIDHAAAAELDPPGP